MKTLTAISTAALLALAVPAFADSSDTTTRPNGSAGATSGTDTKGGSMTEGRSSVTDPKNNISGKTNSGTTAKPNGTPGNTSGTAPK